MKVQQTPVFNFIAFSGMNGTVYESNSCGSTTVFFLLLLKGHLHSSSKINSRNEVTKQYKSRFFLLFLLEMEVSGSSQIMKDPDPGGPNTYGSGTTTQLFSCVTKFVMFVFKCIGNMERNF